MICTQFAILPSRPIEAADARQADDGTSRQLSPTLPVSSLLDPETLAVLKRKRETEQADANAPKHCPSEEGADEGQLATIRECEVTTFYSTSSYKHLRDLYKVSVTLRRIGGVPTEVFVPDAGIAQQNQHRVLINLHGGGFLIGARTNSHLESAPVAATSRIEVISVDYRQGPEYAFPAASEDVASVYRDLIKTYRPANIGIYGCSAGGLLTAEAMAWFQKEHLPPPGAIGMFCEGAQYWSEGDSGVLFHASVVGTPYESTSTNPYFRGADINDPLVFPALSREVLSKFPPSLLISSTRDLSLSSVVHTHSLLVAQGVPAELHVWEGLGHAFIYDPDLPSSREAYAVIAHFFDVHLGR